MDHLRCPEEDRYTHEQCIRDEGHIGLHRSEHVYWGRFVPGGPFQEVRDDEDQEIH